VERWLTRLWWRAPPSALARLLWPLSWLYAALAAVARRFAGSPAPTPVPVMIVGNLVVGGAGKTPIVIALVQALQAAGRRPGVISRGHGRRADGIARVEAASDVHEAGDEPVLIRRRTGVPVFVGRRRAEVVSALCRAHPEVDVIVSDDGLQHHALARAAELIVFDDRGSGNGLLLPAGPLRAPLPAALPAHAFVIYSGRRTSTLLPGPHARRTLRHALPLRAWARGETGAATPIAQLKGRRLTALAGIGAPDQFFAALEAAGLAIERLPYPDHADYAAHAALGRAPWPAGTGEVVTTEKDAVKLCTLPIAADAPTRVWVLPLDCELPAAAVEWVLKRISKAPA
jgi:tetraacyldisaccharide 4'-kinase